MAEDKNKRKSSRHFDLDKPTKRTFNLEKDSDTIVQTAAQTKPQSDQVVSDKSIVGASAKSVGQASKPKRNFNLNKEPAKTVKSTAQPSSSSDDVQSMTSTNSDEKKGSGKKWIAAAVIVVALVAGGLIWHNTGKGEAKPQSTAYAAPDTAIRASSDSTTAGNTPAGPAAVSDDNGATQSGNAANASTGSDNTVPAGQASSQSAATSTSTSPEGTAHELAVKVWDDAYGTGAERKAKLGSRYREVQTEVNRMYRNGYRPAK